MCLRQLDGHVNGRSDQDGRHNITGAYKYAISTQWNL